MNPDPDVVLITGAASGIGRACAEHLAARGHLVFGGDRLEATFHAPATSLRMDVDDEESVRAAVDRVINHEGRLDVVVNNAGFGIAGPIEETSIEEARQQFETNFFGGLRVIRAALPIMRAQGSGLIVNVASIGGLISMPFQGLYSASKFAMEGLSEALRMEVRPFGIRVALLEPADCRTGFTAARRRVATPGGAYEQAFARSLAVAESDERHGSDPVVVARALQRIVAAGTPRLRYTVGAPAERLAVVLKRILPHSAFEPIIRRHYRVDR